MKHRLYPTAAIIALIIAAIFYTAHWLVVKPAAKQPGAPQSTTKITTASTTTTLKVVEPIPFPDCDNLSELYDQHNIAAKKLEKAVPALKRLNDIATAKLTDSQIMDSSALENKVDWAIIERNKARRSYNVLAKKYSAAQLDAFELVSKLEVSE